MFLCFYANFMIFFLMTIYDFMPATTPVKETKLTDQIFKIAYIIIQKLIRQLVDINEILFGFIWF